MLDMFVIVFQSSFQLAYEEFVKKKNAIFETHGKKIVFIIELVYLVVGNWLRFVLFKTVCGFLTEIDAFCRVWQRLLLCSPPLSNNNINP